MTRTFPEWACLMDESGRHWYHLGHDTRLPLDDESSEERPPVKAIYGIPSRDLISNPHWVSSKDPEIIEQVIVSENQKLGVPVPSGPGTTSGWQAVIQNGSRTLVQSVSVPWEFNLPDTKTTEITDYIPQYALFPPVRSSVALWKEANDWVAGYPREGRWAHIQLLGPLNAGEIASEVQLTLLELSAKGVTSPLSTLTVWGEADAEFLSKLESDLQFAVRQTPFPSPEVSESITWEFEPSEVAVKRLRKLQQKKLFSFALLTLLALCCIATAAFFHLWTLKKANTQLAHQIAQHRASADAINESIEKWRKLSPAIETERSVVELFHQVSSLLPEKGVRMTSFEFDKHRIVRVKGETSAMASGLKLRADLQKLESLSDYDWEEFQPRAKGDVLEFNAKGEYRFPE